MTALERRCPKCGAGPGELCRRRRDKKPGKLYIHTGRFAPSADRLPLPDLSGWWREMAQFEGQWAKKRPPELVVP